MININEYIEHTNINPAARKVDILNLCYEAKKYNFRSVCVNPEWSMLCKQKLQDTSIRVVIVYNFPTSKSKETRFADELDVLVQARGCSTREGNKKLRQQLLDIQKLRFIEGKPIKVVIETHILTKKEIKIASGLVARYRLDYVKSSTGLYERPYKLLYARTKGKKGKELVSKLYSRNNFEDLKLIQAGMKVFGFIPRRFLLMYVPKIKIAGGVSYYKDAENLLKLGSDLLGASKSVRMMIDKKTDTVIEKYREEDK